jgi:hypothetical protein
MGLEWRPFERDGEEANEREREREGGDGWEEKTARRKDRLRERRKTEKRELRDDHFFGIKKNIKSKKYYFNDIGKIKGIYCELYLDKELKSSFVP